MAGDRKLIVGFDLGEDFSQISCYNDKLCEPESICEESDESKYLIPTRLAVRKDTKEWLFGSQAEEACTDREAVLVSHLLKAVEDEKPVRIFDKEFTGEVLLEKYFRKSLSLLKQYYPNDSIQKLVVTVKKLNKRLSDGIYQALSVMGIERDRAVVLSHSQSYMYYAFSQKKELWMNDIGLFEFDKEGLFYRQISMNRKHNPIIAAVEVKDFSNTLNYDILEEQKSRGNTEYIFDNIAQTVLYRQVISTLYVTGCCFDGDWINESLKRLCTGRRVFKGQNLYTKGACYAAKAAADGSKFENFMFLTEDMPVCSVSIQGYKDAAIRDIPLLAHGKPWYDAGSAIDIIVDDETSIDFIVKNVIKRTLTTHRMELEGLVQRPARATRLELSATMLSPDVCRITVTDKGFGVFYQKSSQSFEYVINF